MLSANSNSVDNSKTDQLFTALLNDEGVDTVEHLLKNGASLVAKNSDGDSLLHWAVKHSRLEVLDYFLEKGLSLDDTDSQGNTPLLICAYAKDKFIEKAIRLLNRGASIEDESNDGENLLFLAVREGKNLQEIKNLEKLGFSWVGTNVRDSNIVFYAVSGGNPEVVSHFISRTKSIYRIPTVLVSCLSRRNFIDIVDILLDSGANLNAVNSEGQNLVFLAIYYKKSLEEIIELERIGFTSDGTDQWGNTVLHWSARLGKSEFVTHFLSKEMDVNARNSNDETPLLLSRFSGERFTKIVTILVENGADMNATDNYGYNLVHWAIWTKRPIEDIIQLEQLGFSLRVTDKYGFNVLHAAASMGNPDLVRYFISKGIDANAQSDYGSTAIFQLRRLQDNFIEIVQILVANGADVRATDMQGNNLLLWAILKRRPLQDIIDLEGLGFSSSSTNKNGYSALHFAAEKENPDMVTHFLSKGLDANARNYEGNTPLIFSCYSVTHFVQIVDILCKNGAKINAANDNKETVLFWAAQFGKSWTELDHLLKLGAEWRIRNGNGESILHAAVKGGNPEAFGLFFDKNLEIDENHRLEVDHALSQVAGDPKYVKKMRTASSTKKDSLYTKTLRSLVPRNSVVKYARALKEWWKPESEDKGPSNTSKVLSFLISKGASVHTQTLGGSTPLQLVVYAKQNFGSIVDALIQAGANVNTTDNHGDNVLFNAVRTGRSAVELDKLLEHGAKWDSTNKVGDSILHRAVEVGNVEALKYFIGKGAQLNLQNEKGNTPVLHALLRYPDKLLKDTLLVLMEADHTNGEKPGNKKVITSPPTDGSAWAELEDLVKLGNRWRSANDTTSILHLAVEEGKHLLVTYLIFKGANINVRNKAGESLLVNCIKHTQKHFAQTVKALVKNGADVNQVDENGDTMIHMAAKMGIRTPADFDCLVNLNFDFKSRSNDDDRDVFEILQDEENFDAIRSFLQQ